MRLTTKDLRAIELGKLYNRKNLEEHRVEYINFVDTLLYLLETLSEAKVQPPEWMSYFETLIQKFCLHGAAIYNLSGGYIIPSNYFKELQQKKVIDISSIKVVLRAQLETFLMIHHFYINPKNEDLKKLRYYSWILAALVSRQNYPTLLTAQLLNKEKEKTEIQRLRNLISNLTSFNLLSPKQKQKLFDKGDNKTFQHWATIMKECGFNEKHTFNMVYENLSSYAHSEGLSAIQLKDAKLGYHDNHPEALIELVNSKLFVCLLITKVIEVYPIIKLKYNTLSSILQSDLEIYAMMAESMSQQK